MQTATIVADLGFGDAGKGTIVDFLARRQPSIVVRYNGGGQAAHNVTTPDGSHHTFSMFGSGTFAGALTYLSRFVLVDPDRIASEASSLENLGVTAPYARLFLDQDALVVTPFHKAANKLREAARGAAKHGSCGMGIGETMADALRDPASVLTVKDLTRADLGLRLAEIQQAKQAECGPWLDTTDPELSMQARLLRDPNVVPIFRELFSVVGGRATVVSFDCLKTYDGDLVFEGSQGVLLDEWYGFHPYTTWSTTTCANAEAILEEIGFRGRVVKLGVLRSYLTRHGPGPFPTEDVSLSEALPERHNKHEFWQGKFRVGWPDLVLARYAVEVCRGVDALAITNLDRFPTDGMTRLCTRYDGGIRLPVKTVQTDLTFQVMLTDLLQNARPGYDVAPASDYLPRLEQALGIPIAIGSYGPTANDKMWYPTQR